MKRLDLIRNIGIIAHVDAGKTTLTERMLYYSGMTHKLGNVDDGNTITDSDPQESKRGITIQSAAITTHWSHGLAGELNRYQINIIDTPGHVDFTAEVERSLRVLDGAIAVFCARSGVEPQTEMVWKQADRYGVPRIGFINKLDRDGADFEAVVQQIKERLKVKALPLQMPFGEGDELKGVIDLISERLLVWNQDDHGRTWEEHPVPESLVKDIARYKTELVEEVAATDDMLFEKYMSEGTLNDRDILRGAKSLVTSGNHLLVLCGAAYRNIGVQPLLDAIARYFPAPHEKGYIDGKSPLNDQKVKVKLSHEASLTGLVFKVVIDRYMGRLALIRVYSGSLDKGMTVTNERTGQKSKVGRLLRVLSNKFDGLDQAIAGEICAVVGLKDVRTGDTITAKGNEVLLESITFPEPVIGYAIEARNGEDEKQMGLALRKMMDIDPTLHLDVDQNTGQTILKGMGELHLEVIFTRLEEELGSKVNRGAPQVAFREVLTASTVLRHRLKKQSGGPGQFADITFEMGPATKGIAGLHFIDDIKGGAIPKEYVPYVRKGFEEAMQNGRLAGFPVNGMTVRLFDGDFHPNDSHGLDFEIAAREAFAEAYALCKPQLLEPVMTVEVHSPDDYIGNVTADINRRSGLIQSIIAERGIQQIKADIPLRNLFGYVMDMRGMTAGRGSASMSLAGYAVVPEDIARTIPEMG
ncbi:MAG: elongation factor G [Bacteroidota bacterium]